MVCLDERQTLKLRELREELLLPKSDGVAYVLVVPDKE